MKIRHIDGREFSDVTEAEFHRTHGPAGFFPVDDAPETAAEPIEPEPQVLDSPSTDGSDDGDKPDAKPKKRTAKE